MWPLLALALACTFVASCSDENNSELEPRPNHPDDAMPEVTRDASILDANENAGLPHNLQLLIRGRRNGREGCSTLSANDLHWNRIDAQHSSFNQQVRWSSFPPSGASTNETRLRSGNYSLDQITSDYPQFASLSLQFYVTGNLDTSTGLLRLNIQNVSLQNRMPSGVFLTPLYEAYRSGSQQINCRAQTDFSNEFFVENPSREIEIHLQTPPHPENLCAPCTGNVESISVEVSD